MSFRDYPAKFISNSVSPMCARFLLKSLKDCTQVATQQNGLHCLHCSCNFVTVIKYLNLYYLRGENDSTLEISVAVYQKSCSQTLVSLLCYVVTYELGILYCSPKCFVLSQLLLKICKTHCSYSQTGVIILSDRVDMKRVLSVRSISWQRYIVFNRSTHRSAWT